MLKRLAILLIEVPMSKYKVFEIEILKVGIEMLATSEGVKYRLNRNLAKRFTTEALELGNIEGSWIYFESEKEASIMIYESGLNTGNGFLRERSMKYIKQFYFRYIINHGREMDFQKAS